MHVINITSKRAIEYICSYRIECSVDKYTLHNSAQKKDYIVHRNITAAVDIHRKAYESVSLTLFRKNSEYLYQFFI